MSEWVPVADGDPLTTFPRRESWGVSVLAGGTAIGDLDGVAGFGVEQNVHRVISGTGTIDLDDRGDELDWLTAQVQPWWQVEAAGQVVRWPLGVFVCSAPREAWSATGRSWQVELMDRVAILDADHTTRTTAIAAGTVVTTAVRSQLVAAGLGAFAAVTESEHVLKSAMVWEPGTSRRRIVNDLLASINYFAIRADGDGRLVAAPYVAPGARPIAWDFSPGPDAVHEAAFVRDQDLSKVPNRVVLVGQGSDAEEALVGSAENVNPRDRFSYPRRGRWITTTETGVEAASQAVIDALAARRLVELSQVSASQDLTHAALPLDLNAAVLRSWPGGRARGVVQSWALSAEVGAVMTTTIREVGE